MPPLKNVPRLLVNAVYQRLVTFVFPIAVIERRWKFLPALPDGYECRAVATPADCAAVAGLLAQDSGFGAWTAERVKVELLDRLIDPRAALLILFEGKPVACASVIDASTRRMRIAELMYLYIAPAHRGRHSLASYVTYRTLGEALNLNYDRVIGMTDPWRFPALLFYLSNGCVPLKTSLYSHVQWLRVERRLQPTLAKLSKRQTFMTTNRLTAW